LLFEILVLKCSFYDFARRSIALEPADRRPNHPRRCGARGSIHNASPHADTILRTVESWQDHATCVHKKSVRKFFARIAMPIKTAANPALGRRPLGERPLWSGEMIACDHAESG
jgi:hypothetical protein